MAKSTPKTFKKTVWKSCAAFVKLRDADSEGKAKCCTCPRIVSIYEEDCHAGHYVSGHNNTTYFDDAIIHIQCSGCNKYGNGEQGKYGLFLKKKYGYDDMILEELLALKRKTRKAFTMAELKDIKLTFDQAITQLCKEKGLKSPLERD